MKIGVLLSGCGVYDGAEIHESVFSLLAIAELGAEAICIGINHPQHHVINHLVGEEMPESRNMLIEAARIARGEIQDITTVSTDDLDALVIPGGFGSAKNLTDWAFQGPSGNVIPEVQKLITEFIEKGKPIAALCVSPVVVAKSLQAIDRSACMTIGSDQHPSPYDISNFNAGLESTGMTVTMKQKDEIQVDEINKVVSAPCYMMETDLPTLRKNISAAVKAMIELID